jgi:hypothetical protein
MRTIYLVACAATKSAVECPAENLYKSALFRKSRAYVVGLLEEGDARFVLSARHGLVQPDDAIAPYNQTLNAMKKPERQEWSRKVLQNLCPLLQRGDTVVFLPRPGISWVNLD